MDQDRADCLLAVVISTGVGVAVGAVLAHMGLSTWVATVGGITAGLFSLRVAGR